MLLRFRKKIQTVSRQIIDSLAVIIALIVDNDQRVLLARRQAHQSHPNKLEFPGGKIVEHESDFDALVREIKEEVDLEIVKAHPVLELMHSYSEYHVVLKIWLVEEYHGTPHGKEGQTVFWQDIQSLSANEFPEANARIIEYLQRSII